MAAGKVMPDKMCPCVVLTSLHAMRASCAPCIGCCISVPLLQADLKAEQKAAKEEAKVSEQEPAGGAPLGCSLSCECTSTAAAPTQ